MRRDAIAIIVVTKQVIVFVFIILVVGYDFVFFGIDCKINPYASFSVFLFAKQLLLLLIALLILVCHEFQVVGTENFARLIKLCLTHTGNTIFVVSRTTLTGQNFSLVSNIVVDEVIHSILIVTFNALFDPICFRCTAVIVSRIIKQPFAEFVCTLSHNFLSPCRFPLLG